MSFQGVEVDKPLLAVSRLVKARHNVLFNDVDPHILRSTGQKLKMTDNGGTYEVQIWIENPAGDPRQAMTFGR